MNTIKEKMRYISNRILVFGILTEVLFAIVLVYLIKEMMFGRIPVLPVIGIAAGIGLLNVCFWETVTKPYHKWEKMVRRFLDGYQSFDEVKEQKTLLTPNSYEEMKKIEEILNSTQVKSLHKRQAQYLALQNQINPHFLYNTLDGIRSEALIAGLSSVADMTEALASFFRYTISKVENLVSVEEELENCKTYFKIQQYRFGDRLQLHIDYDETDWEEILHCRIPKLTLQPILENSIIHGTELKIGTGNLTIHLERTDSRLLIRISDDGVGMDERTLERLNKKLGRNETQFAKAEQESKGGIALVNVNNRIHLIFGEEYGMHVYSMEGMGTDVELTIPICTSDREITRQGVIA